jgi:hypothetical protein
MIIENHPLCTAVIGAPADMQDGSCSGLPVHYHTDEHGTWAVSFWKPEVHDLLELARGGSIALWVRAPGRQHPVVAMAVQPGQAEELLLVNGEVVGDPLAFVQAALAEITEIQAQLRTLLGAPKVPS